MGKFQLSLLPPFKNSCVYFFVVETRRKVYFDTRTLSSFVAAIQSHAGRDFYSYLTQPSGRKAFSER